MQINWLHFLFFSQTTNKNPFPKKFSQSYACMYVLILLKYLHIFVLYD